MAMQLRHKCVRYDQLSEPAANINQYSEVIILYKQPSSYLQFGA